MGLAHQVICNGQAEGVPLDRPLMSNVLRNAGYSTHAIGKWDVCHYLC
jgi:arylsulfatase A-like enzyme